MTEPAVGPVGKTGQHEENKRYSDNSDNKKEIIMAGPLTSLKVLDFSTLLPGPGAGSSRFF